MRLALFAILAGQLLFQAAALAQDVTDIAEGKALAEQNCAVCHAIAVTGASALSVAPPFRDIALLYDDAELEDALNEGVATEHPAMPDWQMTPDQARQLSAYIMSLRLAGTKKTDLSETRNWRSVSAYSHPTGHRVW